MLKVTLLLEAHDPLAQARIAELEAERDAAERDTTPSPFLGAVTDLAKIALTQAMEDPAKFQEFLKLFKDKRKPFNMSTLVSSLASSSSSSAGSAGSTGNAGSAGSAGSADDAAAVWGDDADSADDNADDADNADNADDTAGNAGSPSKPPPGTPGPFSSSFAEPWTRLDPESATVFVRRRFSHPASRPAPIIARVQRVGGDIPVELGAELHVWSLEASASQAAHFGGASKTAAGAAMAADKALRDAKWFLLGDYDYNTFPSEHLDTSSDASSDESDEDAIAHVIGSVDVDHSPKPATKTRKSRP